MLLMKNSGYWVVKHMKTSVMEHIHEQFDNEIATQLNEKYTQILKKSVETQKAGYAHDSDKAMAMAKDWWDYITKFIKLWQENPKL
jgi:hypothetical protein